jgi:hypothetical protein
MSFFDEATVGATYLWIDAKSPSLLAPLQESAYNLKRITNVLGATKITEALRLA